MVQLVQMSSSIALLMIQHTAGRHADQDQEAIAASWEGISKWLSALDSEGCRTVEGAGCVMQEEQQGMIRGTAPTILQ